MPIALFPRRALVKLCLATRDFVDEGLRIVDAKLV